jgi:hypothetical protein
MAQAVAANTAEEVRIPEAGDMDVCFHHMGEPARRRSCGVISVRLCGTHHKSVDAGRVETAPNLRRGAAYLGLAAYRPDAPNGPDNGADPDRVDEVDSAQIDDYLDAGSE